MTFGYVEMVTQAGQRKYPPPSLCSVKHRSSVVWELTAWELVLSLVKHPFPTVKASLSQIPLRLNIISQGQLLLQPPFSLL